jgi:hypothetical protein
LFIKNDFELSETTGGFTSTSRWGDKLPNQLLTRARRRGASGGDRRGRVVRAHPAGHAPQLPQLGTAGRDSHQARHRNSDHFPTASEYPAKPCAPAGPLRSSSDVRDGDGGVVRSDHHDAGERAKWEHPTIRSEGPACTCWWLLKPKAHHRPGTFHIRHSGVSKRTPHVQWHKQAIWGWEEGGI